MNEFVNDCSFYEVKSSIKSKVRSFMYFVKIGLNNSLSWDVVEDESVLSVWSFDNKVA